MATYAERCLPALTALYTAASAAHFFHNAQFVTDYPGLPRWMTPRLIVGAWFAVAAVGLVGALARWSGRRVLGSSLLAVYGLLGIAGLLHYAVAPCSAHPWVANLTIGLEVVFGVTLAGVGFAAALRSPASPLPGGLSG